MPWPTPRPTTTKTPRRTSPATAPWQPRTRPPPRGSYQGTASSRNQKRWALEIDLFRPFSDAAARWKLELYEKGPDGDALLATFAGSTKHKGYDLKVDRFKPENTDLPEGQRCLLPVFFSRIFHTPGEGMGGNDHG